MNTEQNNKKPFQTIRQLVKRNEALFPDRMAMQEYETGRRCTFGELGKKAGRIGNALYGLGLSPHDRVAALSQNSFEYGIFISIPASGFTFVPLNFRLALPELIGVLNDSGARALFLQDQYIDFADEPEKQVPSLEHFIFIGTNGRTPAGWHEYEKFAASAPSNGTDRAVDEDDAAFFMYTSGTTGVRKALFRPSQPLSSCPHDGAPPRPQAMGHRLHLLSHVSRDRLLLLLRHLLPGRPRSWFQEVSTRPHSSKRAGATSLPACWRRHGEDDPRRPRTNREV